MTNADFAYAPPGQDAGEGLIGDTIFLDRDGNNDCRIPARAWKA